MNQQTEKRPLLTDTLPAPATELRPTSRRASRTRIGCTGAGTDDSDRCRCGDDFCATFYTRPKPEGSFGSGHRCVSPRGTKGWSSLTLSVTRLPALKCHIATRSDRS